MLFGSGNEFLAGDVFVKLDIAFRDFIAEFIGHFRHLLAFLAHEAVVHKPLAHEFFGELALGFALGEAFLIAFGIEIA